MRQLLNYIAPGAPATRRPAAGGEPFLRPEIGLTVSWYHRRLGLDFGERWHRDPAYRRDCLAAMTRELRRSFPGVPVGGPLEPDKPPDLLTGVYGGNFVAALYGVPLVYAPDNWPATEHRYLSDEQADRLNPPDLDRSPVFAELMEQVDWIERENGAVEGFVNWQGVLNNAFRLRGEKIFADMALEPQRALHVFECVAATMEQGVRRLYARQRARGVAYEHFTVSNCLVNMVSPAAYENLLLGFDVCFATAYGLIGVHNCAWDATPYLGAYSRIPNAGYIDMGLESDLKQARKLFPQARRAIMYKPTDLARKSVAELRADLERAARDYGPCDVVFADIEADVPDRRVLDAVDICREISLRSPAGAG